MEARWQRQMDFAMAREQLSEQNKNKNSLEDDNNETGQPRGRGRGRPPLAEPAKRGRPVGSTNQARTAAAAAASVSSGIKDEFYRYEYDSSDVED